jgi:hypothetical protein
MFQPAGSVATPIAVVGRVPAGIASWRPVVVGASTSNAELGHGNMQ